MRRQQEQERARTVRLHDAADSVTRDDSGIVPRLGMGVIIYYVALIYVLFSQLPPLPHVDDVAGEPNTIGISIYNAAFVMHTIKF